MSEVSLRFGLGVDQVSAENSLVSNPKTGQSAARRLVNLDVTNNSTLVRRSGTTQVISGDCHSLWAPDESEHAYYVVGSSLYKFDGTDSTELVTGLTPGFTVSYAKVSDTIFWSNGIQSGALIGDTNVAWGAKLDTGPLGQTYMPQIRGSIVRHFKGRVYAVDGRTVWATEPMDYYHVDLMRGFLMFESEVLLFEPVSNGIFVGTASEGVRFLSGSDFKQFQLQNADSLAPVRGSGVSVDGAVFESIGQGACWLTTRGWVFGAGDGSTKRLTDKQLALPAYESAASIVREHEGMRQLMSFAKGGSESAGASDVLTSEVIRNGVLLV